MEDNPSIWVKLVADGYSAELPAQAVLAATPQGSHLSNLIEIELRERAAQPLVRLNCSAAEAEELVAAIRQGSSYEPPADNPRFLNSLKRTLDFFGLPTNSFTSTSATQEVLLVPSYFIGSECFSKFYDFRDHNLDEDSYGVLMYSSSAQGWANRTQGQDPRPSSMKADMDECRMGYSWLAAVLRSESTGAGEDLCYMLPNETGEGHFSAPDYTPVLMRSNLKVSTFAAPPLHRNTGAAAMAAAGGKLYLLGGIVREFDDDSDDDAGSVPPRPGVLEVYDPHLDTWFAATPPVPGHTLENHVLVTNQQQGMLLALGGHAVRDHDQPEGPRSWAQVGAYDVRSGKWTLNPSGCCWPGGTASGSVAAAAADNHTIMIVRFADGSNAMDTDGNAEQAAAAAGSSKSCPVDLLDLRMWRFRSVESLQGHRSHGVSLVEYDGKVVAVGGARRPLPFNPYGECSSQRVSAFDLRSETWSNMPDLPFTIGHASAVAMRVPSVLPRSS